MSLYRMKDNLQLLQILVDQLVVTNRESLESFSPSNLNRVDPSSSLLNTPSSM